jgi:hypothetical protein
MDERKRAPTEMEVQLLLRNAARKAKDEGTVGDYALAGERERPFGLIIGGVAMLPVLYFYEPMRSPAGIVALTAWLMTLAQGFEIHRLRRVTKALARIAESARQPLPRAPSPPTAGTGSPT